MKAKKLNEESQTSKFIEQIIEEYGEKPSLGDVVEFCWENYSEITGREASERWDEGEFPHQIEEIMHYFNIDLDDFSQEWIYYIEGEEDPDWEEDDDDNWYDDDDDDEY